MTIRKILKWITYGSITSNESKEKTNKKAKRESIGFKPDNITINSALSSAISTITLLLSLFIFIPEE